MIISPAELINEVRKRIQEVDVNHVNASLNRSDSVVIDVREPQEYAQGYIAGSHNLPRGVLEMQLSSLPEVKEQSDPLQALSHLNVYLICRTGGRSALAAESLQRMGFSQVFSLAGGFTAWQQAGCDIVHPSAID